MTMGPGPKYGGGTGWVPAESRLGRPRSGVAAEMVSEVASSDYPCTQLQQAT
jgi:hypothetical protein